MKRVVALAVAFVSVAAVVPSVASADEFATSLSISIRQGTFGGKVRSTEADCIPGRGVNLWRKSPGASTWEFLGGEGAAANGNWGIPTTPIPGAQYRAKAGRRALGGGDHCKAATSPTVTARATSATIKIGPLGDRFMGTVNSTLADCEFPRHVLLEEALPGDAFATRVSTSTTESGAWETPFHRPVDNARYKGTVPARQIGPNACMATESPVTTVHQSGLTIAQGGSTDFHGNVTSTPACEVNRRVTLFRGFFEDKIGSDFTEGNGAWLIPTSVTPGERYGAVTPARQKGFKSCLGDYSNTIVAQ